MTENLLKFLIAREGYSKKAYWDDNGKAWTIGFGNTYWPDGRKVKKGDVIESKDEAYEMLRLSVPRYENAMKNAIGTDVYNALNDNQKDALTSLVFNMGSDNFNSARKGPSTICTLVRNNYNDPKIEKAFGLYIHSKSGKLEPGLVKRREMEGNMYFTPANKTYDINGLVSDLSGYVESDGKDSFEGSGNMFDELLHSADWTVTRFKIAPTKLNNWKNLNKGASCPKVGDLLFGCHNFHKGDDKFLHDHVAIYLGTHNGNVYVAEGKSVSDVDDSKIPINQTDRKVQVARIENSRFGLNTDVITHFAHCNKVSIEQVHFDVVNNNGSQTYTDFSYAPAVGEENMKHFKLSESGSNGILHSSFASEKGISNVITGTTTEEGTVVTAQEVRQNLVNLVNYLLDPLYDEANKRGFGRIYSSQTYRSPALVKAMRTPDPDTGKAPYPGAVQYSQHTLGQAIDLCIYPSEKGKTNASELMKVGKLLYDWEEEGGIEFDQLIYEGIGSTSNPQPGWLHISYKKGGNRKWKDNNNSNCKLAYSTNSNGSNPQPLPMSIFNSWYS